MHLVLFLADELVSSKGLCAFVHNVHHSQMFIQIGGVVFILIDLSYRLGSKFKREADGDNFPSSHLLKFKSTASNFCYDLLEHLSLNTHSNYKCEGLWPCTNVIIGFHLLGTQLLTLVVTYDCGTGLVKLILKWGF